MSLTISIFLALVCLASTVYAEKEKVVICYYGTWATYRAGLGKFDVDHVNPHLCTHLVYSFVGIDTQGTMTSLDPILDFANNNGKDNFRKINDLKYKNPKLKTMLAVGGWNEGSAKFSTMASNAASRQNFIQSALKMILDYDFDGLDLDWEYPNQRDTVYGKADVDNFTQLVKELRDEFDKYGLILTAAVSAVEKKASLSYDVASIAKYLDFINLMSYDMYGAWDPVTGHNAPLYKGEGDDGVAKETLYTVDNAVEYWLQAGCPPEKLVLGVPFYGRTFTLSNANINSVRATSEGVGISGPFTVTKGFIGYNEFCAMLQTESWTICTDNLAKVPYAYKGLDWVSYDDPDSIKIKVEYALGLKLAGIMMWSIETDDFNNVCDGGEFPLLRAINDALNSDKSSLDSTPATISSSAHTTTPYPPTTLTSSTESTITTKSPSTPSTTNAAPPVTESSICKQIGFTSNPEDCSSYYMCIENGFGGLIAMKFNCPSTLLWDQIYLYCNYPEEVVCNA